MQALKSLGETGRDRVQGSSDGRKIGRQRRHAHHRAARPRRVLAVVAVLGRRFSAIGGVMHMHAAMIVGGMIVRGAIGVRHRGIMHLHRGGRLDLIGQARKRRSERERDGRREDAEQIGQDDGTSRPHPP